MDNNQLSTNAAQLPNQDEPGVDAYYLIIMWDDVEPHVLGPFNSAEEQDDEAKLHRTEHGSEHGIYPAEIRGGRLFVGAYAGGFFEDIDSDEAGDDEEFFDWLQSHVPDTIADYRDLYEEQKNQEP